MVPSLDLEGISALREPHPNPPSQGGEAISIADPLTAPDTPARRRRGCCRCRDHRRDRDRGCRRTGRSGRRRADRSDAAPRRRARTASPDARRSPRPGRRRAQAARAARRCGSAVRVRARLASQLGVQAVGRGHGEKAGAGHILEQIARAPPAPPASPRRSRRSRARRPAPARPASRRRR